MVWRRGSLFAVVVGIGFAYLLADTPLMILNQINSSNAHVTRVAWNLSSSCVTSEVANNSVEA